MNREFGSESIEFSQHLLLGVLSQYRIAPGRSTNVTRVAVTVEHEVPNQVGYGQNLELAQCGVQYRSRKCNINCDMITDKERQKALDLLVRSRKALVDAVEGVTEQQARWKPSPDRWSILEYVEHLAISDDALVELVQRALQSPARPESDEERRAREQKIRDTPMPRGVNRAPEALRPSARFASLAEALSAFLAARDRTMEYTRTTKEDLRSHFAPHNVLGPLDSYQWLVGNARHAECHAWHIREIRSLQDFPRA